MAVTDHDEAASVRDFTIRPLSPAIGIEVQDIDLTRPLSDEAFAPIRRGWEENCIALFRGQSLDEMAQVKFAGRFGTVGTLTTNDSNPLVRGQHPGVLYVSNIRVDGKSTGILPDGEMFFHSDTCYIERPAMASMLYAMEVPSKGGHTLYANCFRAYDALPEELKRKLAGKRALNIYDYEGDPTHRAEREPPPGTKQYVHPVLRTHPPTGRKSLYVNRLMTWRILDMPEKESDEILAFLFDQQEKPEFVYEHAWRPGDVILWDNRSCLHARTDFDSGERRRLRRVTVLGDTPFE